MADRHKEETAQYETIPLDNSSPSKLVELEVESKTSEEQEQKSSSSRLCCTIL